MKTMPSPPRLQIADDAKQHLHFLRVETGGRLVENQYLAGKIDGPGDGDDLLDRDGIAVKRCDDIDVDAVLRQQRVARFVHFARVGQDRSGAAGGRERDFRRRSDCPSRLTSW